MYKQELSKEVVLYFPRIFVQKQPQAFNSNSVGNLILLHCKNLEKQQRIGGGGEVINIP